MSWVSIISFIICGVIIIASFRPNTDLFSPGRIFAFVWALAIGLTDLKLSGLQHEWALEIWIQVLIGPIAFLIGAALVYVHYIDKKVWSLNYLRSNHQFYEIDRPKLYKAVLILFSLFLFSYIVIYLKAGEVALFSSKPGSARSNFQMFAIGLFLHNVILIVFFSSVYYLLEKGNKNRKRVLIIASIISIILYAITLQRYQIFMTVFIVLILLYYTTFRIKFRTVFIIGLFIIAFFYFVSSFRIGELVIFILYKMSKMKFSPDYAIFTEPYMYVVMNLENYARSISKTEFYTYGYYTFDFLTAITGLKHWISEYFQLNETPFLISSFNTYTAFWTYYRDFGVLGIFFIPLFGGMALSALYYSFKANPSLQKLAFYGILLFAVIFSFFNSPIGFLWFVYNLLALFIVFKFISSGKVVS